MRHFALTVARSLPSLSLGLRCALCCALTSGCWSYHNNTSLSCYEGPFLFWSHDIRATQSGLFASAIKKNSLTHIKLSFTGCLGAQMRLYDTHVCKGTHTHTRTQRVQQHCDLYKAYGSTSDRLLICVWVHVFIHSVIRSFTKCIPIASWVSSHAIQEHFSSQAPTVGKSLGEQKLVLAPD